MSTRPSFVVTGAAQGVGRAIAERLARSGRVVVLDVAAQLDWQHADVGFVSGDAGDPAVARHAAEVAEQAGPLAGWVNNAAVFRDTALDRSTAGEVLELITVNLALAVTGCHTAVNHFIASRRAGAIVNVSSHQAQRPVRGALPYATAKAAVEGLTRAVAVDHGPDGIRANAIALGSIGTARFEEYRAAHPEVYGASAIALVAHRSSACWHGHGAPMPRKIGLDVIRHTWPSWYRPAPRWATSPVGGPARTRTPSVGVRPRAAMLALASPSHVLAGQRPNVPKMYPCVRRVPLTASR